MIEQNADQLKSRIEGIKKCYLKGFDPILLGIGLNARNYALYPEERKEIKEHMLSMYSEIEEFYRGIPFNELQGNDDFAPFFKVKELLPELKRQIGEFLKNPDGNGMYNMAKIARNIFDAGKEYRRTLSQLVRKVREIPGNENYMFRITDKFGRLYVISPEELATS